MRKRDFSETQKHLLAKWAKLWKTQGVTSLQNLSPAQHERVVALKAKIEELEAEIKSLIGESGKGTGKFAKIRFDSDPACAEALKGLATRMQITVLADESFIVPEAGLTWLKAEGLSCEFLGWVNQDHVVQALRDNLAHPV